MSKSFAVHNLRKIVCTARCRKLKPDKNNLKAMTSLRGTTQRRIRGLTVRTVSQSRQSWLLCWRELRWSEAENWLDVELKLHDQIMNCSSPSMPWSCSWRRN
mmetsp:Transcript_124682/g.295857  ORF Transcript_124682/g.295857 Transcript_124682/m.295857 type:complete len:102 (-) Transcript_124682:113-418(-)